MTDYGYYPRNDANPLFGLQWHCAWSSDLVIANKVYWNYLGGRIVYTFYGDPAMSDPADQDGSRLEILKDAGQNVIGGGVHRADGSLLEYTNAVSATQFLLTRLADAQGHALTFSYDVYGRMAQITAATGETASLEYGDLDGDEEEQNNRVVTQISGPGGYVATFGYEYHDDFNPYVAGWYLTNITDTAGIVSGLTYGGQPWSDAPWAVQTLNTPYGMTRFDYLGWPTNMYGPTLLITEATGGQHLYLHADNGPDSPPVPDSFDPSVIPSGLPLSTLDTNRQDRNTFYWGPLQLAGIGNTDVDTWDWDEFKRAPIRHWLGHYDRWDGHLHISDVLAWEQAPSPDGTTEGQVTWYDYPGRDGETLDFFPGGAHMPAVIARVLPDGSTGYQYYEHNSLGKPILLVETYTKPDGSVGTRTNTLEYAANAIDMTRQIGPQGEQVVSNRFNAFHQVTNSFNALDELTEYTYNANGQLTSIKRPGGLTTTNIYFSSGGSAGRLWTKRSTWKSTAPTPTHGTATATSRPTPTNAGSSPPITGTAWAV